jgi:hypothetical protein
MNAREVVIRRSRYTYPAVGLKKATGKPVHRSFISTVEMDRFHYRDLKSTSSHRRVGAYLSVIYWGHYSGKAGVVRAARALSKVTMAKAHNTYGTSGEILKAARLLLKRGHLSNAITLLTALPQVGFAFASKLCAFMEPEQCGVIDSVIVNAFPAFGFELDSAGYLRNTLKNANRYARYCRFLQREAIMLNRLGVRYCWRDRVGRTWRWRAVDVERGMYG